MVTNNYVEYFDQSVQKCGDIEFQYYLMHMYKYLIMHT